MHTCRCLSGDTGHGEQNKECALSSTLFMRTWATRRTQSPTTAIKNHAFHAEDAEDAEDSENEVPKARYALLGNYPNPFNPNTTISFSVNENVSQIVYIRIYNVQGRVVRVLPMAIRGTGVYSCMWDGRDKDGKELEAGTYFYIIDFGDAILSDRMVLLR